MSPIFLQFMHDGGCKPCPPAPCSKGFDRIGDIILLSTISKAPFLCAIPAIVCKSCPMRIVHFSSSFIEVTSDGPLSTCTPAEYLKKAFPYLKKGVKMGCRENGLDQWTYPNVSHRLARICWAFQPNKLCLRTYSRRYFRRITHIDVPVTEMPKWSSNHNKTKQWASQKMHYLCSQTEFKRVQPQSPETQTEVHGKMAKATLRKRSARKTHVIITPAWLVIAFRSLYDPPYMWPTTISSPETCAVEQDIISFPFRERSRICIVQTSCSDSY